MDYLRDNEGRVVNHHGRPVNVSEGHDKLFEKTNKEQEDVPSYEDMTQRNEEGLVEARKKFYDMAKFDVSLLKIGELAGNYLFTLKNIFHKDFSV